MKKYLFLLCLFSISVFAQEIPSIIFQDVEINIDGQLNEDVWSTLPEHTNFSNYYPDNGEKAKRQTFVKMFHNGKSLFVSAVYNDTTSETQISSLKRDGFYGGGDAFTIIIDPYNKQQIGYYFAANIEEAQTDALIEPLENGFLINKNWNAIWNSSTSIKGNQKYYEMEIPLKILGFDFNNPTFGIQFYKRNIKLNEWTIFKPVGSEFRLFDLRFFSPFTMENLSEIRTNKLSIIPSLTINHFAENKTNTNETSFKPSLDLQYNLSSSLKLDATVNPDFSQIEVDQQVTNLTRFAVNFPEKRNFFLENSDLFSNLGVQGVNPFYTRKIGASSNIQFGLKLSGNVGTNTRLGVLSVQTEKNKNQENNNYGAFVVKQKISSQFSATGFLINRQTTDNFKILDNYNRVVGINLNYISKNKQWNGLVNYGKSFTTNISDKNNFFNTDIWFTNKETYINLSAKKVGRNYITDVGFAPRLNIYDAKNNILIKEGFLNFNSTVELSTFPKNSKHIYSYRYFFFSNNTYLDENKKVSQSTTFFNNALFLKNSSSIYANIYHDFVNLKYGFDILRNGNYIEPNNYNFISSQVGYNSIRNKKVFYNLAFRYGSYYKGTRTRFYSNLGYHLLPTANLEISYEINKIDLNELGNKIFHLVNFSGEIFFSNKLNWTTYIQYNTQRNNLNFNSRLQWEYEPLSYVYLVVTDNYDKNIELQNWGVALKVNYRLDI
ncbi:MAG: DUF5916 domain-containing protein [Melioribacteraceae bacterium]